MNITQPYLKPTGIRHLEMMQSSDNMEITEVSSANELLRDRPRSDSTRSESSEGEDEEKSSSKPAQKEMVVTWNQLIFHDACLVLLMMFLHYLAYGWGAQDSKS